jgi:biopolymer transport protein ExbB
MTQHIPPELVINATLYILFVFSILTWTIIVFKCWQFTRNTINNRKFDDLFLDSSQLNSLLDMKALSTELFKGTHANIAQEGLEWLEEYAHLRNKTFRFKGNGFDLLQRVLEKQLQHEQHTLETGLSWLASIGSTAPFVGLFGTVLGIMHAMHEITQSGSTSLDVVAGPIGDALVATAIGIAVAVPAVLAYNFFLRRVKRQRQQLENFAAHFLIISELPAAERNGERNGF